MMFPPMFVAAGGLELEFLQGVTVTSLALTHTVSSVSIGPAKSQRRIVVVDNGGWDTVTVGGVSAVAAFSGNVWIADVPSGTTADIVWTRPSAAGTARLGAAIYSVLRMKSATATDTYLAVGNNPSIDVLAGGVIFGWANLANSGVAADVTWSGATVNHTASLSSAVRYTFASTQSTNAATPYNITLTDSVPTTPTCLLASFR